MSQNSRNVYFLETKAPAGWLLTQKRVWESTLIKLIHLYRNLKIWNFLKKSRVWWKFTYQNSLFTENLNGPYGPYEPLLWDISRNKWPKNWVFDENYFFKNDHVQNFGKWHFWWKKRSCGVPPQQNKGFKPLAEYSLLNSDRIQSKSASSCARKT